MANPNFLTRWLQSMKRGLSQVLLRFPVTLFFAVLVGVCFVVQNHGDLSTAGQEILGRIEMTLAIGLPFSAAVVLLVERLFGKGEDRLLLPRWLSQAVVVALLALYGLFLTTGSNGLTGSVLPARVVGLSFASVLLFIAIPRFPARAGFVREQIHLFFRLFTTGVFTSVLFGGLCGVVAASDILFVLHVDPKIYLDIIAACWTLFAPVYFLSGVLRPDQEVPEREYPLFMKMLALYIVAPITLAYTLILLGYLLKIAFTLVMPSNMVFNLVFWFAAVVLLVGTVLIPLRAKSKFANAYSRWMPFVLLPLEAMMMLSLSIRIAAYGFTEIRYLGLLAGLWVIAITVVLAVRSKAPFRLPALLPATLALVAVIAVVGPLSCFSIARASQNARFDRIVASYGLLSDGKLTLPTMGSAPTLSKEDTAQLSSIASWFSKGYGLSSLRALPSDATAAKVQLDALGISTLAPVTNPDTGSTYYNFSSDLSVNGSLDVSGYDLLVPARFYGTSGQAAPAPKTSGYDTTVDPATMVVTIWKDGARVVDLDLAAYLKDVIAAYPDSTKTGTPISHATVTWTGSAGGATFALVPEQINVTTLGSGTGMTFQDVNFTGYLLVKAG